MKLNKPLKIKKIERKVKEETVAPQERKSRSIYVQILLSVFTIGFIALALFAKNTTYFPIDLKITLFIQQIHNSIFYTLMQIVSYLGYSPQSYVLTVIIFIILLALKFRWEAVVALINAISTSIVNVLIKSFVHRMRPSSDLVHVLVHLNDFSFPSGHVMFYTAFFGFLLFLTYILLKKHFKRSLIMSFFAFLILTIGISRIYLGDHWASDVFGAYLFGTIWLVLTINFYEWGKKHYFKKNLT